jgi:Na+-transporting NADH:ubiquinone oxidoreductase subunit NqrB
VAAAPIDPRSYQIAVLASLFLVGQVAFGFGVDLATAATLLGVALALQALLDRALEGRPFEPRSALVSGLSLCLLLRTSHLGLAAAAAAIAIGSKFAFRWRGKHLFNPTNLALVALLAVSDRVWASPGQWGAAPLLALFVAGAGGLVLHRAGRADITLAFLGSYAGLLLARALWLGDPLAIPLHQIQSGSLLIFAFYMISDPRTTPDSRAGRVAFAAAVAALGAALRFLWFEPQGMLFALAACAPLVPLLDRLLPGPRHRWRAAPPTSGGHHVARPSAASAPRRTALAGPG